MVRFIAALFLVALFAADADAGCRRGRRHLFGHFRGGPAAGSCAACR